MQRSEENRRKYHQHKTLNYTFGVLLKNSLVSQCRAPAKAKVIQSIGISRGKRSKSLIGNVSYVQRYIHFYPSCWSHSVSSRRRMYILYEEEQHKAFLRVIDFLSSRHTIITLVEGFHLILYLIASNKLLGGLLAQEVEGVEHSIYYLQQITPRR